MLHEVASSLVQRCSRHIEAAPYGLELYDFWIASEEELHPGVTELVREVSLGLLTSSDTATMTSAIQALACTGNETDITALRSVETANDSKLASEVVASITRIQYRAKALETLLDEVQDEATFVLFARALAKERERASKLEALSPQRYTVDGALGWKNADISSFIFAGLSAIEGGSSARPPSWSLFAQFLYLGKVVE